MPLSTIRIEDEVFAAEGETGIGAVREVRPDRLLVHFEGFGEVELGPDHILSAHDGKVLVDPEKLPADLRERLPHIHDGEYRRPSET
ncbi:MAG: hypothetical protein WBA25_18105 [Jannaschia sp.]